MKAIRVLLAVIAALMICNEAPDLMNQDFRINFWGVILMGFLVASTPHSHQWFVKHFKSLRHE